ncbi:MAG: DUF5121 domain-containing protein [Bacteroidales bacterium]|nr:DUF5121 domain-containing protein [Bacteroidales bacterium]
MKNIVKIFAAAAALVSAFACAPEYITPDKTQLPEAGKLTPEITVDQATNYVTFSIKETGVVPMWIFGEDKVDGKANKKYAYTGNGITLRMRDAGTHTVELKAYNANGVSLGSKMVEYTLENTYRDPFDPAPYYQTLSVQDWYWLCDEDDHFGCGGAKGTNEYSADRYGLNWWAAKANEKAGFSMYDDVLSFTADGKYKFNPGDGKTYVNKDSGFKPEFKTGDEDYVVDIDAFECDYTVENAWNDAGIEEIYLVLPEGKNLSYIPNPEMLKEARYQILDITKKKVTFIADQGSISWRYVFGPKGAVPGLDYESAANLWKPADAEGGSTIGYYYAPGWNKIADPETTHNDDTYTFAFPAATSEQWQAQVFMTPTQNIAVSASKEYAISCLIQTNKDLPGVTIKFTQDGDDNNFLCADRVAVPAGKEFLYMVKGVTLSGGKDADALKLVLDFGGNADDTKVSVRRLTVMEYTAPSAAINDVPFAGGKADLSLTKGEAISLVGIEPTWWDPDFFEDGKFIAESGDYRIYNNESWLKVVPMSGGETASWDNGKALWIIGTGIHKPQENAEPGWTTDEKVDLPFAKNGNKYQLTAYITGPNFKVFGQANWGFEVGGDMYSSVEANDYLSINGFPNGAASDNGNIWSGDAFVEGWYVMTITDNGDGTFAFACDKKKETFYDIEGETNLYRKATITPELWYSPASWAGGLNPEYEIGANNDFSVVIPAETGGQEWMGQNKLHTGIATSNEKIYDFCCTLLCNEDVTVTIKLTGNPEGEGDPHAFFYDGNVQLEAGVPFTYKKAKISQAQSNNDFTVIFDFGRVPVGKTVSATQICFQEHMEK